MPDELITPLQYHLFKDEPDSVPVVVDPQADAWQERVLADGVVLVTSDDQAQLVVSGFGISLGKKSERLTVRQGKTLHLEVPFFRLSDVVVASRGISVSSDLVEELCTRGIRLAFLRGGGQPYAMLTSPMLHATVAARRAQILAYSDERSVVFSKMVVTAKLANQERLLRYFGKYLKQTDSERFARVEECAGAIRAMRRKIPPVRGGSVDEARQALLSIEGMAGRHYWNAVTVIISQRVEFFGREHRGATDAVNSLLNYGYGILYAQVWGAVLNAGLEPFAGFLHVDRPGKPSLVLDLVEEFRQPVVDRAVIAHINLGEAITLRDGMLDEDTRRRFARRVMERLEAPEPVAGKRLQVRSIIQRQARQLATFLRNGGRYRPFLFKW